MAFCNKSYVSAAIFLGLIFPILNILECLGKEPEEVGHGVLGALFAGFLIFGAYNRNSNSIQVWMILVFLDIIIYIITGIVKLISMSAKNEISGHFREIFIFCGMTFFDVITIFVAKKARTEIDGEWCGYFYCDTNIKGLLVKGVVSVFRHIVEIIVTIVIGIYENSMFDSDKEILLFTHGVFGTLLNGFLVFGAHKRNSKVIFIWMILAGIQCIPYALFSTYEIIDMFTDSGIFVLGDVSLLLYSLAMIAFNIWSMQTAKKATEEIYLFSFLMPKVTYCESIKPMGISLATQISIEESPNIISPKAKERESIKPIKTSLL